MPETNPAAVANPAAPRRFGWPMRLLLSVIVFDMMVRSLCVVVPWQTWLKDLKMRRLPERLPDRAERAGLEGKQDADNPRPVFDRVMESADGVWNYLRPWPGPETRPRIHSWSDGGKWAVAWVNSRLEFAEDLAGIREYWPMFSPNAAKKAFVTRARLVYDDGSSRVVRNHADPEDLTRYSHWHQEKVLDHELRVEDGDGDNCKGYCNLLAHRYPRNGAGAVLKMIYLYEVRIDLSPPDADPRAFYQEQMEWTRDRPRGKQVRDDFYEYDVAARSGKMLTEE
jgi:hypothetical protein